MVDDNLVGSNLGNLSKNQVLITSLSEPTKIAKKEVFN